MDDKPQKQLEVIALESGDVEKWAQIMARRGQVIPSDPDQLELTFHLRRMRLKEMPIAKKLESRDILKKKKVIDDMPITTLEKLKAQKKNPRAETLKNLLKEAEEVILWFPSDNLRNTYMMRLSEEYRGQLDLVRSNVRYFELYLTNGKHIKFVTDEDEYFPLPGTVVACKTITQI